MILSTFVACEKANESVEPTPLLKVSIYNDDGSIGYSGNGDLTTAHNSGELTATVKFRPNFRDIVTFDVEIDESEHFTATIIGDTFHETGSPNYVTNKFQIRLTRKDDVSVHSGFVPMTFTGTRAEDSTMEQSTNAVYELHYYGDDKITKFGSSAENAKSAYTQYKFEKALPYLIGIIVLALLVGITYCCVKHHKRKMSV